MCVRASVYVCAFFYFYSSGIEFQVEGGPLVPLCQPGLNIARDVWNFDNHPREPPPLSPPDPPSPTPVSLSPFICSHSESPGVFEAECLRALCGGNTQHYTTPCALAFSLSLFTDNIITFWLLGTLGNVSGNSSETGGTEQGLRARVQVKAVNACMLGVCGTCHRGRSQSLTVGRGLPREERTD